MDYYKTAVIAAASLACISCAVTPASEASQIGISNAAAQESAWPRERMAAFDAISGVEFPHFFEDLERYCEKNAFSQVKFVEYVQGYATEESCRNIQYCARPLFDYGYQYIEAQLFNYGDEGGLPSGKYRFSLEAAGHPDCGAYATYLESLEEELRVTADRPSEGQCLAVTPLRDYQAKYILRNGDYLRQSDGDLSISNSLMEIAERDSGRVVGVSRRIHFEKRSNDRNSKLECRLYADRLVRTVIPPTEE